MQIFRIIFVVFSLLLLGACSNLGGAVGSAAKAYWNSRNPPSYAKTLLQPQFTYLEVLGQQNSALLVLAEIDKPQQNSRPVETWVSSSGEVLRTQGGFLVGSAGISYLPEVAQPVWAANDNPIQLSFNMASAGLSNLNLQWQITSVPAQMVSKPGPLLQRAQQVPQLQYKLWVAATGPAAARLGGQESISQLVATDPTTGKLVYGQFCLGPIAQGQCIEYLLRSAARNL